MTESEDKNSIQEHESRSVGVVFLKVRKRGLSWALKRLGQLLRLQVLRSLNSIRHTRKLLGWLLPSLYVSPRRRAKAGKRVLAIWDFRSQPYSIGDLILLQEISLALCHQHQVSSADICFLAEPQEPSRPSFSALNVNSSNYKEFVASLIPVILAGDHVAEFHLFDSHLNLEKYVTDNADKYHVWPAGLTYMTRKDLNHLSFAFLNEFYGRYGYVPSLTFRPELIDWARSFLTRHVMPNIPFVVQLRNAGRYNTFRNSNMDAWVEFFQYCEGQFPVRFIVVCSKSEVDKRLRGLSNVVIAKDLDTTIDQDLALIQCSAAYMGMSSGPSTVAFWGDKPYSILNAGVDDLLAKLTVKHSWGVSFVFANEHQRLVIGVETLESLISEFSRLFSVVDVEEWQVVTPVSAPLDNVPLRLR
jgi:hypothetical protein